MFKLYTKENCIYCDKAKQLLADKNIGFTNLVLGKDFTRDYIIENFPTMQTFPVILHGTEFVGGYGDLVIFVQEVLRL